MRLFSLPHRPSRTRLATASIPWERVPPREVLALTHDHEGRPRRTDAPYLLPKDGQEESRLDFQHHLLHQVLQGDCFAPVKPLLQRRGAVLDVGSGTGRWGREFAKRAPLMQVHGFDLEPATRSPLDPANYQIHRGNLLHGLPFAAQSFDYVHQVRPV